jgi:hypothetical protein
VESIELASLHSNLGVAILVLGAVVILASFQWRDLARAVRSAGSPMPDVAFDLGEARWSETSYANRVALNLVVRLDVANRSKDPWRLSLATLRGYRALAVSIRQLDPAIAPRQDGAPAILPGAAARIGIHFVLDALPPADPAAPFAASLVLVDQHVRESALRIAARGPKG